MPSYQDLVDSMVKLLRGKMTSNCEWSKRVESPHQKLLACIGKKELKMC